MFRLLAVTLLVVLPVISSTSCSLSHTANAIDITNYKLCLLQERIQGLENRLNGVGTCIDKYTAWTGRSNAMIMNLDRHYLVCPSKYFLVSFRFQRQGSAYNSNVRYAYRCCKI